MTKAFVVHSTMDVITNSSSEFYTFPSVGAVEGARKILADVLAAVGAPVDVDECFKVYLWPNSTYELDRVRDRLGITSDSQWDSMVAVKDSAISDSAERHRRQLMVETIGGVNLGASFGGLFTSEEFFE